MSTLQNTVVRFEMGDATLCDKKLRLLVEFREATASFSSRVADMVIVLTTKLVDWIALGLRLRSMCWKLLKKNGDGNGSKRPAAVSESEKRPVSFAQPCPHGKPHESKKSANYGGVVPNMK